MPLDWLVVCFPKNAMSHFILIKSIKSRKKIFVVLGLVALASTLAGCGADPQQLAPPLADKDANAGFRCEGSDPCAPMELTLPIEAPDAPGDSTQSIFWAPHTPTSRTGIIFVSGVDGGFIEPSDNIYHALAETFAYRGAASVFVKYRQPGELGASVEDTLAGAQQLRKLGISKMAIIGWSFGGAVITNSAVRIPEVQTIVGFSPQSRDTEAVQGFTRQSILLMHSKDDENVPFISSQQILDEAPASIKRQLVELEGFDHILTGARTKLEPIVTDWLGRELSLN
jgi:alpha/beta superfamily hydrolase